MVEGWRPRSWAQLGQQQRSRSGFSTLDSARAASALERVVLSLYNQQWLLPSISGLTFPEETPSALQRKGGVREEREERWGQGDGRKRT